MTKETSENHNSDNNTPKDKESEKIKKNKYKDKVDKIGKQLIEIYNNTGDEDEHGDEDELDSTNYYNIGVVYEKMGQPKNAEEAYTKAAKLAEKEEDFVRLGDLETKLNRPENAKKAYLKAAEDMESRNQINAAANLYLKAGEPEKAIPLLEKMTEDRETKLEEAGKQEDKARYLRELLNYYTTLNKLSEQN